MKMYDKSDLKLIRGLLADPNGNVITPDFAVIQQANQLETLAQKTKYLAAQPDAQPMPSLDGFKRKSIMDNTIPKFKVSTPHLDFASDEAMRIMDEIDDANTANAANKMLEDFGVLLDFATNDFVVDTAANYNYVIDTPTLGNILELTVDDITEVVAAACGIERFNDDDLDVKVDVFDLTECEDCEDTSCFFNPYHESDMVAAKTPCSEDKDDEVDED